MSQTTEAFNKDVTSMEAGLRQLSRNKVTLRLDLAKAKQELKDAEAAFDGTKDAMTRLSRAQIHVDQITRNLKSVTTASREMEKAISSAENKASGSGGFFGAIKGLGTKAMWSQLGQMGAQAAGQYLNYAVSSQFGTDNGSIFSSALSGLASGASIGVLGGTPLSIAIGAGIGLAAGIADGFTKNYEKKDDFFKDYYKGLYEDRQEEAESGLQGGSTTAGSREQSYKAFEKRLGKEEADAYLADVKHMAARTNYGYDEILGYSKLLLNSYGTDEILGADGKPGLLMALSDATAGLGLDSGGVEMFIKGLSRMRTTGKVTQEYLNYFSERGLDVYEALARGTGKDKSQIADMVTKGKIKGADAAAYIVEFLNAEYGGLSEELMGTYDAMVANLQDVETNVQEGYGTGYNEERKSAIRDKTETLDGELGDKLSFLNKASGFATAYAENVQDNYWMDVMEAVFSGDEGARTGLREGVSFDEETRGMLESYRTEYLKASYDYQKAEKDGDKAGMHEAALRLQNVRDAVEVLAGESFTASEPNKLVVDSQNKLIEETRALAVTFGNFNTLYGQNQLFTVGRSGAGLPADGINPEAQAPDGRYGLTPQEAYADYDNDGVLNYEDWDMYDPAVGRQNAWGLDRVPYDNYPALLHQGERVLTAQQAREADRRAGVSVVISGNEFHIREDADVDRVAQALAQKLQMAAVRG